MHVWSFDRKGADVRLNKSFKVSPAESGPLMFEGYASTWTRTPDSYGDVVVKGAFAESLQSWAESGKTMPVLWLHDQYDPGSYVAKVVDIVEDDHGLKVTGEFFDDDPTALKVHRLLKERMVNEMSFAFDLDDAATIMEDGREVRELRKLNLFEVSIVPQGANSDTSIDVVKTIGDRFTAEEIAALKEIAAQSLATEEVEVGNKPDEAPEAGNPETGEAVSKSLGEVVARLSKQIDALAGQEGGSK